MGLRSFLRDLFSGRSLMREELRRIEQRVLPLSIEEASAEFERFLMDATKYVVEESPPAADDLDTLCRLPATVQELFRRFARIEEKYGDTQLVRGVVGPSEYVPGAVRIGRSTDLTEVIVRAPAETAYRVDGSERGVGSEESYPSIYHFLLSEALLLYPVDLET